MKSIITTPNFSYIQISIHCILATLRATSFFIINFIIYSKPSLASTNTNKVANNIVYANQLNFFRLYCVLRSIINENHFEYILTLPLSLHNFILIFVLFYTVESEIANFITKPIVTAGFLYVLDFLFTIKCILNKRAAFNFDTFKKIGADQKINEAYNVRRTVKYLSLVDLFLVVIINGRFFLPPVQPNLRIDFSVTGILAFTLIQQILINARENQENKIQRRIAIGLSLLKSLMMIVEIVFISFNTFLLSDSARSIKILLYCDIMLDSVFLSVYLYKDLLNFGCGLKEHLEFKTEKIRLN